MKFSRKREAILSVIRSTTSHPSAEWVYVQLKPKIPDLSLGTVYRNLALFRQTGEIDCVATVSGQERYDGNTIPHAHFICSTCGCVLDVEAPEGLLSPSPCMLLQGAPGALVESCKISYHGQCGGCRSKQTIPV